MTESRQELPKEILDPKVLQFVILDDVDRQLKKMNRRLDEYLSRREFKGKTDSRELSATDQTQWIDLIKSDPHKPWISALFYNGGPDTALIAINQPDIFHPILYNASKTFDFADAEERIKAVFYKCDPGETAAITVDAQY